MGGACAVTQVHEPPAQGSLIAMDLAIVTGAQWPEETGKLLRALPEWFGIEQSILGYIDAARTLPSAAALLDGKVVGVCMVRHHTPVAAEVELLAVARELHRRGIGRRLIDSVAADLRTSGVRLLQVKTFGPSGRSDEYARTRAFYESLGFMPLEERTDIWGIENPCLISVKALD